MVFSTSATDLIIENYKSVRDNASEFFDKLLSTGYDIVGVIAVRSHLKEIDAKRPPRPAGTPVESRTYRIYVQNPAQLDKEIREVMNTDNYKSAKDFCLHNFKILWFDILTAIMITHVFFVVLGLSTVTAPAVGAFVVNCLVRDMLDKSIDKSHEKVSKVARILATIDNKLFSDTDWLGGKRVWGFFRSISPYPQIRASFVWH